MSYIFISNNRRCLCCNYILDITWQHNVDVIRDNLMAGGVYAVPAVFLLSIILVTLHSWIARYCRVAFCSDYNIVMM